MAKKEPKNLDLKAIQLSMVDQIREKFIGLVGVDDASISLFKIHSVIELSKKLGMKEAIIEIKLSELVIAYDAYTEGEGIEIEDDD